ncbi:TPA: phage tailspike protein [Escherichia coli]|nr:phage tail protein [Escherichia coli]
MTDITANVIVSMPSQLFTMARSFKAVANGKIYIGKIDTDPVNPENQIQVYLENENGTHIPVAQPIVINAGGYPVYNGQIAKFVTVEGHSMAVYDAYGSQQFYFPNILKYDPDQFRAIIEGNGGAASVGTSDGSNVQDKLDDIDADISSIQSDLSASESARYSRLNRNFLAAANKRLRKGESLTIVCVGDSITAGYDANSSDKVPADNGDWATHAPITYPKQLENSLNAMTNSTVTVINRGYSGDTAKASFDRWTTNPNAQVAHIMLGINDTEGKLGATYEQFCEYIEKLVKRYIDWGCGVVLHTTTALQFNSGNNWTAPYYQFVQSIAEVYGCPVFESEIVTQYAEYDGIYSDGAHFNKQGYFKYGRAVASFILAGGYVQNIVPITGLYSQQVGRSTTKVGFWNKGATIAYTRNSYLTNGGVADFAANSTARISFSFYLGCELATLDIVGILDGAYVTIAEEANETLPEYAKRGPAARNRDTLKRNQGKAITETSGYQVKGGRTNSKGLDAWAGTLVGAGWKTIYISTYGANATNIYVSGIRIKPARVKDVIQVALFNGRPAETECFISHVPYPLGADASSTPAAAVLGTLTVPMPDGMQTWQAPISSFYDTQVAYLDITVRGSTNTATNPNGHARYALQRFNGSSSLQISKMYGDNIIAPSSATVYSADYNSDSTGEFNWQPVLPSDKQSSRIVFTFPGAAAAYYTFAIRCDSKSQSQASWYN